VYLLNGCYVAAVPSEPEVPELTIGTRRAIGALVDRVDDLE
jgi:hypothetical protein